MRKGDNEREYRCQNIRAQENAVCSMGEKLWMRVLAGRQGKGFLGGRG